MPNMYCTALLLLLFVSLQNHFFGCRGYAIFQSLNRGESHILSSDNSDFMGDIARDRVTIKSLAKLAAKSPVEKELLDQFEAPSNFERDELLRTLDEINSMNVSWFQLTPFAQKRYAKSVMCILDAPSALDVVSLNLGSSKQETSGTFSLGSAADGLWRLTLSNEVLYESWTKGMQMYFNIRDAGSREKEAVFEQIIQLPLPSSSITPSRIRRIGSLSQNKNNGEIEYTFRSTAITWLGREWKLPTFGRKDSTSAPSGCLGVSYMDGKIWLDVRDLSGETTRDSAKASKFSALTYISGPKEGKDWLI